MEKHQNKLTAEQSLLFIGLDVHADTIAVAIAEEGRNGEVRSFGSISGDLHALEKLLCKIRKVHGIGKEQLRVVYEAVPSGYVIVRRLRQWGIDCIVVAPSKIPKKPGDKVKTDKRDAVKLARLHRAGELTGIHIPDAADEAIRDLCRARTDAVNDQRSLRSQFKGFLLRHGYIGRLGRGVHITAQTNRWMPASWVWRRRAHVKEAPTMAIGVDKAMGIHES